MILEQKIEYLILDNIISKDYHQICKPELRDKLVMRRNQLRSDIIKSYEI